MGFWNDVTPQRWQEWMAAVVALAFLLALIVVGEDAGTCSLSIQSNATTTTTVTR